jgi:GNAT superfamily N-acetyltransferase
MITFTTELPVDTSILTRFEEQHPKELRWGFDLKLSNYYEPNSHYIWLIKDGKIAGEIILGWTELYMDGKMVRVDAVDVNSFTILPEFQGKGLGHMLLAEGIIFCMKEGFSEVIAAARQGASLMTFLKAGAVINDIHRDWNGCGEDYLDVSIHLK